MTHGLFLSEKIQKIVAEVAEIAGYLWERGWAERNAGNISVNVTEIFPSSSYHFDETEIIPLTLDFPSLKKNTFLLTASGVRMRDLARSPMNGLCLLQITGKGNGYQLAELVRSSPGNLGQKAVPTSELPTHLAIQEMLKRSRPGRTVLLHAHVPEFIALTQIREFTSSASLNKMLLNMHPETRMFVSGGIGYVPYSLSGSESLAKATIEALEEHDIAAWEKHGLLAVGSSVAEAFDIMDLVTQAAKIFFLCRNAGYIPEGLSGMQSGGDREKFPGTTGNLSLSGRRHYSRKGLKP